MKIRFIEIEANAGELRSARGLSDVLFDALASVGTAMRSAQNPEADSDEGEGEAEWMTIST